MALSMSSTESNRSLNTSLSELEWQDRDRIMSYENLPLVSLEHAVESIIPFDSSVRDCVDRAKRLCRQNSELTIDESAAVYLYTMSSTLHKKLNEALRVRTPDALAPWLAYLKLFLNAVEKLPSCTATLWRGINSVRDSHFAEDSVQTWFSVTSCTYKIGVAGVFAGSSGTLLCMEIFHGKDITSYSSKPDEDEILLLPGIRMQEKGKYFENGVLIVHLQEW